MPRNSSRITEASAADHGAAVRRILALLVLFLVFASFAGVVRNVRRGVASRSWPSVQAVVTTARAARNSKRFEYQYEVGGRVYRSVRAGFAQPPFHQEYRLHDVGDTIVVRYDPADPSLSVVRPGFTVTGILGSLVPGIALLAVLMYATAHQMRGDRRARAWDARQAAR